MSIRYEFIYDCVIRWGYIHQELSRSDNGGELLMESSPDTCWMSYKIEDQRRYLDNEDLITWRQPQVQSGQNCGTCMSNTLGKYIETGAKGE